MRDYMDSMYRGHVCFTFIHDFFLPSFSSSEVKWRSRRRRRMDAIP